MADRRSGNCLLTNRPASAPCWSRRGQCESASCCWITNLSIPPGRPGHVRALVVLSRRMPKSRPKIARTRPTKEVSAMPTNTRVRFFGESTDCRWLAVSSKSLEEICRRSPRALRSLLCVATHSSRLSRSHCQNSEVPSPTVSERTDCCPCPQVSSSRQSTSSSRVSPDSLQLDHREWPLHQQVLLV